MSKLNLNKFPIMGKNSKMITNLSSKLFQPLNIIPQNATVTSEKLSKSHRLMVDMGIIKSTSAGTYHLLPLGIRSLEKLRKIVKSEMCALYAQEIKLPFLVDYNLWKKSGRCDAGFGFFKFNDRHGRDLLLSPTNEEAVANLIANIPQLSHNQLPLLIYQISTKFRDEVKPRCGLIKSKEFEMKDLYSFDSSLKAAESTYESVSNAYKSIFKTVDVPVIRAVADSGDMKGIYSHEYHVISDIGEDNVMICNNCSSAYNIDNLEVKTCSNCNSNAFLTVKGIEVGHTFLLGSVYTEALSALFKGHSNIVLPLAMASYGFGMTRFLAAAVEHLSSEQELMWPKHLAPFNVIIITPKEGSKEFEIGDKLGRELYLQLNDIPHLSDDVILDERGKYTIGKRLLYAKRTGYPFIVIVGAKVNDNPPLIEVHDRRNLAVHHMTFEEVISFLSQM
ncbi:probable proline--tRNA ligase, mitochondrial [Halyomorpha halys]|uniref:probable proline--tRNA ligase, mitochondrial n=1 Tax=Halyomorpha halys TaxID=286706 RepID=UPI0006D4F52B|nr:probable proline--tRNA ligase, mitochondrial [Halyomorpha halys]